VRMINFLCSIGEADDSIEPSTMQCFIRLRECERTRLYMEQHFFAQPHSTDDSETAFLAERLELQSECAGTLTPKEEAM
jgi:hypothetical protein